MSNEIKVFENEEFGSVRTVVIDDEPWFVGKSIATMLGYHNANEAIGDHVDDEDKLNSKTLSSFDLDLGQRGGWLINESGLYSLILSSKLPKAKEFKRWVTKEVLPSIRKHGLYATDDLVEKTLEDPDYIINILTRLKEERTKNKQLEEENAIKTQQIAECEPKVTYYDMVLQSQNAIPITQVAKDYGKSAVWLNDWLHIKGIQYKVGNTWVLYSKYAKCGYTKTKTALVADKWGNTSSKIHTYWTQKGRLFIYDLLKQDGILPIIELDDDVDRISDTSIEGVNYEESYKMWSF